MQAPSYTVTADMFEGLYVHALGSDTALQQAVVDKGYDRGAPLAHYPIELWVQCLDLAWRKKYPQLERYAAWRLLGRAFIEGYFKTVVGRFISAALPLMRAERFIERVPGYVRTGLSGQQTEVKWLGPQKAQVTLRGPHEGAAWVMGGVLEVCLERLGHTSDVRFEWLGGDDSRITIAWPAGR